jgi:hypothetical protein
MRGRVAGAGSRNSVRPAVLRYVAACSGVELMTFVRLITQPVHSRIAYDERLGIYAQLMTTVSSEATYDGLPPSQMLGFECRVCFANDMRCFVVCWAT